MAHNDGETIPVYAFYGVTAGGVTTPKTGITVTASVLDPSENTTTPTVTERGGGFYEISLELTEAGAWSVTFSTTDTTVDSRQQIANVLAVDYLLSYSATYSGAYATVADVQARIGAWFTITSNTNPSTTQVETFLAQKSSRLNMALRGAGYGTIPATNAADVAMLADMVANAVALHSLYIYLGADSVPQTAIEVLSGWREFLADLRNGDAILNDQKPATRSAQVLTPYVYGTND